MSAVGPERYSKRILTRMYSLPVVGAELNMFAACMRVQASVPLMVSKSVTLALYVPLSQLYWIVNGVAVGAGFDRAYPTDGVGIGVGDGEAVGVGDGEAVGVGDGVGEAVGVGVGDEVGLGVGEGEDVGVGEGEGVGVGEGVSVGVGAAVGVGVGVAVVVGGLVAVGFVVG